MKKIKITTFSLPWYGFWAFIVIALILLRIFVYPLELNVRNNVLLGIGIFSFIYLAIYKFGLRFLKDYDYNIFNELPFYLCNLSTLCAIYAAITGNRLIGVFCYSMGFAGALLAFMKPDPVFRNIELFSWKALGFFGYHSLLIINCLAFTVLDVCRPQLGDVWGVVLITLCLMLLAHLVNFTVRSLHLCDVANYMFTYDPGDNGILLLCYRYIPVRCLYLLPLSLVVAILYVALYFVYQLFVLIF